MENLIQEVSAKLKELGVLYQSKRQLQYGTCRVPASLAAVLRKSYHYNLGGSWSWTGLDDRTRQSADFIKCPIQF